MVRFRLGIGAFILLLVAGVVSAQTSSVSGRVANPQGGPVRDAEISLRPLPPPGAPSPAPMRGMPGMAMLDRTVRSGADGAFTVDKLTPGPYVLQVDAPGFDRWSQEVSVSNATPTVAVKLVAREVLVGETAATARSRSEEHTSELQSQR